MFGSGLCSLAYRPVDWVVDVSHYLWQGSGVTNNNKKPGFVYIDGTTFCVKRIPNLSVINRTKPPTNTVRIICISDTHERHALVEIPNGDVLIHAGDILTLNRHLSTKYTRDNKVRDVGGWFDSLTQIKGDKIVIGGNHDLALETMGKDVVNDVFQKSTKTDSRIRYLEDEKYICYIAKAHTSKSLVIYGTPVSYGRSKNRAFQNNATKRLNSVPKNVDILITHGPISDDVVGRIRPRLHVYGHIHNAYGARIVSHLDNTTHNTVSNISNTSTISVNASIMDHRYQPKDGPVVIDLPV